MLLSVRDEDKLEEGRRQGLEEGRREGRRQVSMEIVKNLYNDNLSMEQISSLTGIPLEEVKNILNATFHK